MTKSRLDNLSPTLPKAIVPLTEYGIVSLHGKDAGRFLQGQISCNIEEVTAHTYQTGTANTAKGRTYSFFRIAQQGDAYLLRMPKTMIPLFESIMGKYSVFYKAQIQPETQWQVSGIMNQACLAQVEQNIPDNFGQNINETWSDKNKIFMPSPDQSDRFECWHKEPLPTTSLIGLSSYSDADWRWLDMLSGIPELCPAISDTFIPQMLNLDRWNAIHFQKGCYTGQEIIARMHYLGKLKKRMQLFLSDNNVNPKSGSWLLDDQQRKSAQVIRYQQSISGPTLIQAVTPIDPNTAKTSLYLPNTMATPLALISMSSNAC